MLLRRIFKRLIARSWASWPKLLIALVVLAALPALAYWRGLGTEPSEVSSNTSEMVVETIEQNSARFNLVLKEKAGPRRLVVNVGIPEAISIASDLNISSNLPPVTAYSMTRSITDSLGGKIERVVVNNASDKSFFAKIILATDNREISVDAAPSDAIALAVRAKAPIYVDADVLDRAGVLPGH